ncbi:MAG TPA: hypothetical protein DGG95_02460 [Cytophagales bacterium]|nr:hypothetical protein [Cytophagales bacterium]
MRPIIPTFFFCVFISFAGLSQVNEIKSKSSSNASSKSSGSSDSGSGSSACSGCSVNFYFELFKFVGATKAAKLGKADSIHRIVSVETFFQGAIQPSSYYLFNPRIRGNWGLFSTDLRFNYLIEQNVGNGTSDLSTWDWQVLQLNLITSRNVTGRVGAGTLFETFGAKQTFFEWTTSFSFYSNDQKFIANAEYRLARDYNTSAVPRREINLSVEKMLFQSGAWHGYATLGGVYQRYYQSVSVWGLQVGLAFRIF